MLQIYWENTDMYCKKKKKKKEREGKIKKVGQKLVRSRPSYRCILITYI